MKTLDEVIKAYEICIGYYCSNAEHDVCPYFGESDMGCMKEPEKDALHYLKEYQRYQNTPSRIGHMAMVDLEKNDALTWDELKQMEGKPVWVEHKHYNKWLIVYEVYENTIVLDGNGFYTQYFSDDNDKEIRWQAYRKERG